MNLINFTKMQGLGNDFVILDYEDYLNSSLSGDKLAQILCNRHFGIGADGLIIVNPKSQNADISWFFYNSDGSIAQMCGNGIRCFAKYVYKKGIISKNEFSVETKAGIIIPQIIDNDCVRVNMGIPILSPKKIPAKIDNNLNFKIYLKDIEFIANAISMGNPHCVIFREDNTKELALKYGVQIETSNIFPEKTNVEFVKIISRTEIQVDVWERGCGITLACGTGACASAVAGILNGLLNNNLMVHLPGGQLKIEWNGTNNDTLHPVFMSGPAEFVFTGSFNLNNNIYN